MVKLRQIEELIYRAVCGKNGFSDPFALAALDRSEEFWATHDFVKRDDRCAIFLKLYRTPTTFFLSTRRKIDRIGVSESSYWRYRKEYLRVFYREYLRLKNLPAEQLCAVRAACRLPFAEEGTAARRV